MRRAAGRRGRAAGEVQALAARLARRKRGGRCGPSGAVVIGSTRSVRGSEALASLQRNELVQQLLQSSGREVEFLTAVSCSTPLPAAARHASIAPSPVSHLPGRDERYVAPTPRSIARAGSRRVARHRADRIESADSTAHRPAADLFQARCARAGIPVP
jgi:hypothetical protein